MGAAIGTKRPRTSLSPDLIVDTALRIVEDESADALTFRRLGHELGSAPTAVLRHFRDKDDLLLALGERLLAEAIAAAPTDDPDWRVRVRGLAEATRTAFLAHPRVTVLVSHRTLGREAEFRGADVMIGAMLDAGLHGLDAALHYRVLVDAMLAWAAMEASVRGLPAEARSRDAAFWSTRYARLPRETYPAVAEVAEHLPAADATDAFPILVECLISAIEIRGSAAQSGADGADRTG